MPGRSQPKLFTVPPTPRRRGRARRGLDATVAALRADGALADQHEAWLSLARIMADQLDGAAADADESRFTIARVAAGYHAVLEALAAVTAGGADSSALDQLLAELLEDPETEPER